MKKLLKYMKEYRLRCFLAPAFKMLEAASELFVPLVMSDIIDIGIANADRGYIGGKCVLLGVLALLGLSFTVFAQYFSASAAVGFTTNIKKALYSKIMNSSFSDIDRAGSSALLSRMTNDVKEVQNGTNLTLRLLVRSPFIVFGAAIMAFTVDVKSALVFAVVIPVLTAVVFALMLYSIPLYSKAQKGLERVLTSVREYLFGVRVIRAFGIDEKEEKRFDEKNEALEKITVFAGKVSALMNPLTYVIINCGIIFLLYIGGVQIKSSRLSSGQVVALYNYMSQILIELLKLASLIISISKALAAAKRIEGVLEGSSEESGGLDCTGGGDNAIEIKNLTFTYEGASSPALYEINLTVKKGETVGIIGSTGSGKTTLINLIPGFYKADEGEVLINGHPVAEYDKSAVRREIHTVPQKSVLFRGSVRSNLLWGADASDAELEKALDSAMAHDFVFAKDGLDTWVGEDGAGFSGGQKQRLSIARALVGKPKILILDDSASALDLATDKALRKNIGELDFKPTTIIISQRTSSIMHADKILVLNGGRSVGIGTNEELLKNCNVYREIYASQFGEASLPDFVGEGETA